MSKILLDELKSEITKTWRDHLYSTEAWKFFTTPSDLLKVRYPSFVLETYHYTKQSPLIQSSTLAHFQGQYRNLARPFLSHALEEESHYKLCENDLKQLGFDTSELLKMRPLPATEGYIGFIFNRIANYSALAYLGYLYQLEFMAIEAGPAVAASLLKSGINPKALTFLNVHTKEDVDHISDLDKLFSLLPSDLPAKDAEEIIYTSTTSSKLYVNMMSQALDRTINV